MFKIPAEAFKIMVSKSAKGASCNKVVPVTSLVNINLTDGTLCLTTTDTENTLEVYRDGVQGKNMGAVVGIDLFSKLIAKQTCDQISIDLKKDYLLVKGNGEYKVPLTVDEEGMVKFPEFSFDKEAAGDGETVNLTSINQIVNVNKPSVSTNPDKPQIGGYYAHVKSDILGDSVISTNEAVICFNGFKLFKEPAFITPSMMDLLTLNTAEKIQCYKHGGYFLFETDDIVLHGPEHDLMEEFPLEAVAGLFSLEFPARCTVSKLALQAVLDRLALFIEAFDKNGAYLIFSKEGLQIKSKQNSSDEVLKYHKSEGFQAMQVLVDIPMLKVEVDSTPGDTVTIAYGQEAAISISSGNVTKVIALLDDEDVAGGEDGMDYDAKEPTADDIGADEEPAGPEEF